MNRMSDFAYWSRAVTVHHPTRADIAYAMELRSEGVKWPFVAIALGTTESIIKGAVYRATHKEATWPEA